MFCMLQSLIAEEFLQEIRRTGPSSCPFMWFEHGPNRLSVWKAAWTRLWWLVWPAKQVRWNTTQSKTASAFPSYRPHTLNSTYWRQLWKCAPELHFYNHVILIWKLQVYELATWPIARHPRLSIPECSSAIWTLLSLVKKMLRGCSPGMDALSPYPCTRGTLLYSLATPWRPETVWLAKMDESLPIKY